jgi:ubiquinone/menaquinone biosynthesis C-methylase UbiE
VTKNQAHVRYSADQYDDYTARYVKTFDDLLASRVVEEMAGRAPGAVLLDIGTGTARLLLHLARLPELRDAAIVGTDVFDDMVEAATRTVADAGLSARIRVLREDVHEMQLPDEYADVIISRSTVHHWSNPPQAFREIHRLLKPGGVAVLHDVRRDPAPEAIEEFNRLRALAGIGPSHLDEKFTVDEVSGFLAEAGLAGRSRVHAADKGLRALGYEVVIRKPVE